MKKTIFTKIAVFVIIVATLFQSAPVFAVEIPQFEQVATKDTNEETTEEITEEETTEETTEESPEESTEESTEESPEESTEEESGEDISEIPNLEELPIGRKLENKDEDYFTKDLYFEKIYGELEVWTAVFDTYEPTPKEFFVEKVEQYNLVKYVLKMKYADLEDGLKGYIFDPESKQMLYGFEISMSYEIKIKPQNCYVSFSDKKDVDYECSVFCDAGTFSTIEIKPKDGNKFWTIVDADGREYTPEHFSETENYYLFTLKQVKSPLELSIKCVANQRPVFDSLRSSVFDSKNDRYFISNQENHRNLSAEISSCSDADLKLVWFDEEVKADEDFAEAILASKNIVEMNKWQSQKGVSCEINAMQFALKDSDGNLKSSTRDICLYAIDEYDNISECKKITLVFDFDAPKIEALYYEFSKEETFFNGRYYETEIKTYICLSFSVQDTTGIQLLTYRVPPKYQNANEIYKRNDGKIETQIIQQKEIEIEENIPIEVYLFAEDGLGNSTEVQVYSYDLEVSVNSEVSSYQESENTPICFSESGISNLENKDILSVKILSKSAEQETMPGFSGIVEYSNNSQGEIVDSGADNLIVIRANDLLNEGKSAEKIIIKEKKEDGTSGYTIGVIDIKWDNEAPILKRIEYDGKAYKPYYPESEDGEEETDNTGDLSDREEPNKDDSEQEDSDKEDSEQDDSEQEPEENDAEQIVKDCYQVFTDKDGMIWLTVEEKDTRLVSVQYAIENHVKNTDSDIVESESEASVSELCFEDCIFNEDNNKYGIQVQENMKGFVYVKLVDAVNNEDEVYVIGVISETKKHHGDTMNIIISGLENAKTDNDGYMLFKKLEKITIDVQDTHSGIAKVEWDIAGGDGNAAVSGEYKPSVEANKDNTENQGIQYNIDTEFDRTIDTSQLEGNGIRITITLTDNVGHTSQVTKIISIDKTKPEIKLSYKGGVSDATYKNIYKDNRQAVIEIKERNFKASDVNVQISSSTGKIPGVSEWTMKKGDGDPKQTTYTATITFADDGEYDFKISYTDMAGNVADDVQSEKFIIDKTLPQMDITYNNVTARNGSFYADTRVALITVKEQNFDPSRMNIQGLDIGNGTGSQAFNHGTWISIGDVHRLTVEFSADGTYRFGVTGKDKAGNDLTAYSSDTFIVDQTMPEVIITGVKDQSANNTTVTPIVEFKDRNYNRNGTVIELKGANRGVLEPKGEMKSTNQGQIFTFDAFSEGKDTDDLYTLRVVHSDMAGNRVEKTIRYSINRYGSVYVFKGGLEDTIGKYVNVASGIEVDEINVDKLVRKTINVVLAFNGETKTLTEGIDYHVVPHEEDNMWSRYTYKFEDSLFKQDGAYKLILYSVDDAGNKNTNSDLTKEAEIEFGIDNTAPAIIPLNLESGMVYNENIREAIISIADNFVLNFVQVFVNGEEVEITVNGDKISFQLPEMDKMQSIRIVARDIAGNESVYEMSGLLITTNLFIRWTHNTPLLIGTIAGGVVLLCAAIVIPVLLFRRKNRPFH